MSDENSLRLLGEKTEDQLRHLAERAGGILGVSVVDLTSGERFGVNESTLFPQASAIKIPILMEVYKQADKGAFKLTDLRRIEKTDKTCGSGILCELGDGTVQMNLHDLCILMITLSDNTATNMLIDLVGMNAINETMRSLGLKQTFVRRRMMDTAASLRGDDNVSTPAEAARVMELLWRGEFVNRAICDDILEILKKPKPSPIIEGLPEGIPVAFKPGGLPGVSTAWAIVLLKERPYILTVMESYGLGRTAPEKITEISRLLYDYFNRLRMSNPYGSYLVPAKLETA